MDNAFIQDRITATKKQIVEYENAASQLAIGGIQSYLIDTGQSEQRVTKFDLVALQRVIDSLYNRCTTLETRLTGSGVVIVRAGW